MKNKECSCHFDGINYNLPELFSKTCPIHGWVPLSLLSKEKDTNPKDAVGIKKVPFSLLPERHQPSGTCNMSRFEFVDLQLSFSSIINFCNRAKIRVYSLNYNVLRIVNGLSGLVFSD